MNVLSVNVGRAERMENAKASGLTGIFKRPVDGPVFISAEGLAGDAICDVENHGGMDQAVYVFGQPDYDWWSAELAQTLFPGTFGENLTLSGLESATLSVGDVLWLPNVTLQVTSPRIPCVTLAARMGDPAFGKRFRRAERPGVYCRVLREGEVAPGDPVWLEPYAGPTVTVLEMFRDFYGREWDEAALRRYLAAPIAIRDRVEKEAQLAKLVSHSA